MPKSLIPNRERIVKNLTEKIDRIVSTDSQFDSLTDHFGIDAYQEIIIALQVKWGVK
jgi:hypothetical protein